MCSELVAREGVVLLELGPEVVVAEVVVLSPGPYRSSVAYHWQPLYRQRAPLVIPWCLHVIFVWLKSSNKKQRALYIWKSTSCCLHKDSSCVADFTKLQAAIISR